MTDKETLEAAVSLTAEDIEHIRKRHHPSEKAKRAEEPSPSPPPDITPQPNECVQPSAPASPPAPPASAPPAPPAPQIAPVAPRPRRAKSRGKRAHIEHPWPELGTIIEADYFGTHYTAEIIAAPPDRKLQSGKLIRITSGTATGTEHASMSGAMEAATEHQRNDQGLGRKGCLSGWDFWKWPGKDGNKH